MKKEENEIYNLEKNQLLIIELKIKDKMELVDKELKLRIIMFYMFKDIKENRNIKKEVNRSY